MLFPWDIARFRSDVSRQGNLTRFGYYAVRRANLATGEREFLKHEIRPSSFAEFRPPECIFGRPADLRCLDGIAGGIRSLPAQEIYSLNDASIIGTIAVLSAENVLYCDGPATSADDLAALLKYNESNAHGFVLSNDGKQYVANYLASPEDRYMAGRTVFISGQEIGNFGCFIYWSLPQMMLLAVHHQDPIDQYVVSDRSPWILEALELLGFPQRPVYTVSEICGARFQNLTFLNFVSPEGLFHPNSYDDFQKVARRARIVDGGVRRGPRFLYVSRALSHVRAPGYRVLENETAIQNLAERRGFERVLPETLSLANQIRLFDSADTIIGPSGSGMLGSVFAKPGTVLVDYESFHVTVRQHARIYSSTEKRYCFCFGKLDPNDSQQNLAMRRWQLDESDVAASLDWAQSCRS